MGETIADMFDRAVNLEGNARLLYESKQLGPVLALPDEVELSTNFARTLTYYANLELGADAQQYNPGSTSC